MSGPVVGIGTLGYGLCTSAFLLTAAYGAVSRLEGRRKIAIVGASLATAGWAATDPLGDLGVWLIVLRSAAWVVFLCISLGLEARLRVANRRMASVLALGAIAGTFLFRWVPAPLGWGPNVLLLALSVAGLILIENLFRNCNADSRWGVRWICIGLGMVFVYDFYSSADGILTRQVNDELVINRSFVDALAVPLLILGIKRGRSWLSGIRLSREVVFHSTVLIGSGFYLLAMSLVGMVLRAAGRSWGSVLQNIFLAAAVLTMLAAVSSGTFRSTLKILISKHFFRHKYDYRTVWLNFIRSISKAEKGKDLEKRILCAIADIFDCPGGALWSLRREDDAYFPVALWNFGGAPPVEAPDGRLATFLERTGWIIDVNECRLSSESYGDFHLPDWLAAHRRAWMVVPLIHNGRLEGFLILCSPRSKVTLGWEEIDLLKTVGAQAASYLAEQNSSRELADARRLGEFTQRFAFVVHDIKNVVSQMSLMVENASVHGTDPEFQRDMLITVVNAVGRMRNTLAQLKEPPSAADVGTCQQDARPHDLAALLRRITQHWRRNIGGLSTKFIDDSVMAFVREDKLITVLDHLLQNAAEAAGPHGSVELILRQEPGTVIVEVRDDGPGMEPEYVRDHLFRPLDTGKADGLGIGAYQARELVRSMGGRLEVDSLPGRGTTMRLCLRPSLPVPSVVESLS